MIRGLVAESWIGASATLIGIGLFIGSTLLVALGAMVLGTGGAARLWSRLSLEEVFYSRKLSEHRVFVGEKIDIVLTIANRKVVPVPWIEVRESMPREMPMEGGRAQPTGAPGLTYLYRNTALGSRDQLEWPLTIEAIERGYYRIGPTRLRSGDLFGFFEREETHGRPVDTVVVYPKTYPLPDLGLDSARPFGEQRGGNRIYEDPSRVVGVRDYQPGDPLKRVDWKATARMGRLQSRLYEPSRTQALVVALNIPTLEKTWLGSDPVVLERGISVAASIAQWGFEQGSAIGLIANGSFPDADRPIRLGAGRRPDQLLRVLEALAMVTSFTTSPIEHELEERGDALPAGATVVLVTGVMTEEIAATLFRLRAGGHYVHVVRTSDREWPLRLAPITVSDIVPYMREHEAREQAERDAREAGPSLEARTMTRRLDRRRR